MGIGVSNAKFVLLLRIDKLDVSELVGVASKMNDNLQLQSMGQAKKHLVFKKLKMYFSTGGDVLEEHYDRGIHVRGNVQFFDKTGDFDGKFSDDGVIVKAGIDNFKIGGLEVKSAQDAGKRASMDIEMTSERQKIFIDGKITYYDLEFKMLINADLQRRLLFVDVSINLMDALSFALQARLEVPESQRLEDVVGHFEAELRPDLYGVIFEGITRGIDSLEKLATESIEAAQTSLHLQINEKEGRLFKIEKELNKLKAQAGKEISKRKKQIEDENKAFADAASELRRLEEALRKVEAEKHLSDNAVSKQRAKIEQAQRKHDQNLREKSQELGRKTKDQKAKQKKLTAEIERLEERRDEHWGDALRKYDAAKSWEWWDSKFKSLRRW